MIDLVRCTQTRAAAACVGSCMIDKVWRRADLRKRGVRRELHDRLVCGGLTCANAACVGSCMIDKEWRRADLRKTLRLPKPCMIDFEGSG